MAKRVIFDPAVAGRLGGKAGDALATGLERTGRLRPGVETAPDVVEHLRFVQNGAFKFAAANGASEEEASQAAEAYRQAFIGALAARVATTLEGN